MYFRTLLFLCNLRYLEEAIEEAEEEYQARLEEYYEKLEIWKKNKERKKVTKNI